MPVSAVLCWSEYYNGKWHETKTLDVNSPVYLASFPSSGTGAFDRSYLQLFSEEYENALGIVVSYSGDDGMMVVNLPRYILFNTHNVSDVIYWGEWVEDESENHKLLTSRPDFRIIETESILTTRDVDIDYYRGGESEPSLTASTMLLASYGPIKHCVLQPRHIYRGWREPILIHDSRHVLLARTEMPTRTMSAQDGYGLKSATSGPPQSSKISTRIARYGPANLAQAKIAQDMARRAGRELINPSPGMRFVTEDAFVKLRGSRVATVSYGDKKIGPKGIEIKKKGKGGH